MNKIIVPRHTFLIFIALLCTTIIYGQRGPNPKQSRCLAPHVPNQAILQFDSGVGLKTINNRLINGQVTKSVPVDRGSPLNIHLAEFTQNPGIYDLNGAPHLFNTVEELLIYLEQNEACNGGINGSSGRYRVKAADLNYTHTLSNNNDLSSYYNINSYMPAPHCRNIPMINNISNLNNQVKVALIDGGYTDTLDYNELFSQTKGFDYIDKDNTPNDVTFSHHGDRTAFVTVAALSTAVGPNVNHFFELLSYKVLDEKNTGELFDVLLAIHQAIIDGANIINLSLEMYYCPFDICSTVSDAIFRYAEEQEVIFTAAAGNKGVDIDKHLNFCFPGSFQSPVMVVVGATEDCLQNITNFSNYGSENVDLFAEGDSILTNFGYSTGTSFAAPYAAGITAVAMAKMQQYNHEAVICAILDGTDYKGWDKECTTGGVLNAPATLDHSCLNTFSAPTTTRQSPNNAFTSSSMTIHPFFSSNELLNISITAIEDEAIDISVFAITGKLIRREQLGVVKGFNDLHISNLNQAPTGLYIIQAKMGNEIISKKCYKNY